MFGIVERQTKHLNEHSLDEQEVLNDIRQTLAKVMTSYEHCINQLQEYSNKCEQTDRKLDERIDSLEDDHKLVRGAAKMAVWAASISGGITAIIEIYRFAFKVGN